MIYYRLHAEYQRYCCDILNESKTYIFDRCYEIAVVRGIYEIMMRTAERLPESITGKLLKAEGILQLVYSEWLKKDDGYHLKLEEHVMNELELLGKGI